VIESVLDVDNLVVAKWKKSFPVVVTIRVMILLQAEVEEREEDWSLVRREKKRNLI
jgi:hypothetical protein